MRDKIINLKEIPPVPVLTRALVLWATGNGAQRDLPAAVLARELCEDKCFFCGREEANPTMRPEGPWESVALCVCLPAEDSWERKAGRYEAVLSGWEERQEELAEKASSGALRRAQPVYKNICVLCHAKFEVTVGTVTASIKRYGRHAVMNRCKECKSSHAATTNGARPRNKEANERLRETG